MDKKAFQKLSITTPGKRSLHPFTHAGDRVRSLLEALFAVSWLCLLAQDSAQCRLACRQGCSLGEYLRCAAAWVCQCMLLLLWRGSGVGLLQKQDQAQAPPMHRAHGTELSLSLLCGSPMGG